MLDLTVDLHGKGVIVTAAGGSIGSACALALARCGASLALNDINPQALAETAARVQALGATVLQMPGGSLAMCLAWLILPAPRCPSRFWR
jgi:NAD(P)-dependent dehydrogenase (short-subunit alcohol dehydrogenase family)